VTKVLIIDDDYAVCTSLSLLLEKHGYEALYVQEPEQALILLKDEQFDLIVMDMNFSLETSGEEGLQLLQEIKKLFPTLPVILITAWGSIDLAVNGMKLGAVDFITKPWNNELFLRSVNTAITLSEQNVTSSKLNRKQLDEIYDLDQIIGTDPQFLSALSTICRVSETDASVLILGESGTGKELIAEAIHKRN